MIFQKKLDYAMEKLHEASENSRLKEGEEGLKLEKNDAPAMLIAAFLIMLPAASLVLFGMVVLVFAFVIH